MFGPGKEICIDDQRVSIGPADIVTIVPGQRHKVWQCGDGDLTLPVICSPPYSMDEVVLTE